MKPKKSSTLIRANSSVLRSETLTASEIESLKQDARTKGAFVQAEFARIFLESDFLQIKYGGILSKKEIADKARCKEGVGL